MATTYNFTMENSWTKGSMTISHTTAGKVTVKVKLWRPDGGTSYNNNASKNFYISIAGTKYYHTVTKVAGTSGVSFSSSKTVSLSDAGTASVAIVVDGTLSGTTFEITGNNSKTYSITNGTKATYAVKYNANGGSGAPASQTKTYGVSLTLRTEKPTRTGYTFQGWGTSASDTSVNYKAGGTYTANAAVTLYAIWKANTYTIKYNANGGSGAPASQTKTYGKTLTLSSTKPTRASETDEDGTITYTFRGWGTSAGATTVAYKAGGSYTANAGATLYAVWGNSRILNKYSITYDTGDSGFKIASQTKTDGTAITLSSVTPVWNGYTFTGWNTNADGSGTTYGVGATYSIDDDIILYAQWTPWTHTVAFNANGGSGVPSNVTKTSGVDLLIPETIPTRSGYIFRYWNTASNGSGTSYYPNEAYNYTQNGGTRTLYAVWVYLDILLYKTNKCAAIEFVETPDILGFGKGGIVYGTEFIEGGTMKFGQNQVCFAEIIEK